MRQLFSSKVFGVRTQLNKKLDFRIVASGAAPYWDLFQPEEMSHEVFLLRNLHNNTQWYNMRQTQLEQHS